MADTKRKKLVAALAKVGASDINVSATVSSYDACKNEKDRAAVLKSVLSRGAEEETGSTEGEDSDKVKTQTTTPVTDSGKSPSEDAGNDKSVKSGGGQGGGKGVSESDKVLASDKDKSGK